MGSGIIKREIKLKHLLSLKDLTKDSFLPDHSFNNTFCLFKSIDEILHLIYSNKKKSIISYDLINNKKIVEIKNAHKTFIQNFRHCFDKINRRDLIMSLSFQDSNLKLWNIRNFECLLNLENVYISNSNLIFSSCFINDDNAIYLITSIQSLNFPSEPIKLFDLNGSKIKEFDYLSKEITYYIDIFYDNKSKNIFIITGNFGKIISYDYKKNKIYHKYDDSDKTEHINLIINNKEKIVKLIEASEENILIWNFHSGKLLKKIKVNNNRIYSIYLWNNDYLFLGFLFDIELLDIKNKKIIKKLIGHNEKVTTIKRIFLPSYGDCLISQGERHDQIKLWTIKL